VIVGRRLATFANIVIPGFMPGIQPTERAGVRGTLDPGDKHWDDTSRLSRGRADK
jgi:hypothetical protein